MDCWTARAAFTWTLVTAALIRVLTRVKVIVKVKFKFKIKVKYHLNMTANNKAEFGLAGGGLIVILRSTCHLPPKV